MYRRTRISSVAVLVVGAAAVVSVPAIAAASASGGTAPPVTIRIEGSQHTLLATTTVRAPKSGSVTKDGAPKGDCPTDSAAGVLQLATKGHWSGTFSTQYGPDYFVTKILGETESGRNSYWAVFVNNISASKGVCDIKLHAAESILFAAVSVEHAMNPLVTKAPKSVTAGRRFAVTVDHVDQADGKLEPVAGASVAGRGVKGKTNSRGVIDLTDKHSGALSLKASKAGYIRAAAVTVTVKS